MKLVALFALALTLYAEDAPKPTVEELTAQVMEAKAENERLTKMLNAYAQKYMQCDQNLTMVQTLGVQPQKPVPHAAGESTGKKPQEKAPAK